MASFNEIIERAGDRLGQIGIVERIEGMMESLSPRDRRLLLGLAGFFLLALCLGGAWVVRGALANQASQITAKKQALGRAQDLLLETQALRGKVDTAEASLKGQEGFIIQSFLERKAQGAGITPEQLPGIQVRSDIPGDYYKETVVEVQLKETSLGSLVAFLHGLEYGDRPVHVKSLRARAGRRDRSLLDVDLELTVVSLNSET